MWFPVDVEETAQEYSFVADVPGLVKKDIKVHDASTLVKQFLHLKADFSTDSVALHCCSVSLPCVKMSTPNMLQ